MFRFALIWTLLATSVFAETIFPHPTLTGPFQERREWAVQEAARKGNEYWIGYSIERWMGENEYIASGSVFISGGRIQFGRGPKSLQELLTGKKPEPIELRKNQAVRKTAREALNEMEGKEYQKKVLKDVAILLRYSKGKLIEAEMMNLIFAQELKKLPLYWLGTVDLQQSYKWLEQQFTPEKEERLKEDLMCLLSAHELPEVVPFLRNLVLSRQSVRLREAAMFELSENHPSRDTLAFLELLAWGGPERQIQNAALEALFEAEPDGVASIIRIAKNHPQSEVRKHAIELLGESHDPRAVKTLIELVTEDVD